MEGQAEIPGQLGRVAVTVEVEEVGASWVVVDCQHACLRTLSWHLPPVTSPFLLLQEGSPGWRKQRQGCWHFRLV